MEWFWIAVAIGLMVVELSTTQLVCIWFSLGAIITSVIKLIFSGIGFPWQLLIFALVSVGLLIATRPLVRKYLRNKGDGQKTNLELVIDKEAIVTEEINNIKGEGAIKVNGLTWSARSEDGNIIPAGTIVVFKEINGNKAIVKEKGE